MRKGASHLIKSIVQVTNTIPAANPLPSWSPFTYNHIMLNKTLAKREDWEGAHPASSTSYLSSKYKNIGSAFLPRYKCIKQYLPAPAGRFRASMSAPLHPRRFAPDAPLRSHASPSLPHRRSFRACTAAKKLPCNHLSPCFTFRLIPALHNALKLTSPRI